MNELEEKILSETFEEDFGFVCVQVIKNIGTSIPGAHVHGPYQVACMNMFPKRINDDINFLIDKKVSFIRDFDIKNPEHLKVKDYGTMILAVPYFMKRPLEAIIYPKDFSVQWLRDLSKEQRLDLAKVTSDVSYALSLLMPARGNVFDYNFVFHTGPIGTMYIEIFPSSQRPGGFERVGLYVCQGIPVNSAEIYRRCFEIYMQEHPGKRFNLEPSQVVIDEIKKEIIDYVVNLGCKK
ncbi:MAG: hypothetical protein Q8N99_02975 [Nanoarchaeota archaeon]|nr:hypothetical protein [Nanoarchaeota archaeon]